MVGHADWLPDLCFLKMNTLVRQPHEDRRHIAPRARHDPLSVRETPLQIYHCALRPWRVRQHHCDRVATQGSVKRCTTQRADTDRTPRYSKEKHRQDLPTFASPLVISTHVMTPDWTCHDATCPSCGCVLIHKSAFTRSKSRRLRVGSW